MKELTLTNFNGIKAIDSRVVAEAIEKPHNDLMKDIRRYCEYLGEGKISRTDFFIESNYTTSQNKALPCYLCTRKGCEMIANKMTGAKGTVFTAMYINAFHSMEQKMKDSYMIADPVERAKRWIEEQEEKKALETKIETDRPKVLFANAVECSDTSILIGDLAKLIKQNGIDMGQKRLFAWLREHGYLIKSGSSVNMPTQKAMNMELFEVKERSISNPDGSVRITRTTKVTGKGQTYFINKFLA